MELSRCKRISIAIAMIILFLLVLALGVGLLVIAMCLGATVGAVCGPCMIVHECRGDTCGSIVCTCFPIAWPILIVVGVIAAIIGIMIKGIQVLKEIIQTYFLTISFLCNA